jgi:hypothetical protein
VLEIKARDGIQPRLPVATSRDISTSVLEPGGFDNGTGTLGASMGMDQLHETMNWVYTGFYAASIVMLISVKG